MPLKITGELTSTTVEHTDGLLPAAIPVPAKREALEALGLVSSLIKRNQGVIIDGQIVPLSAALETLRRFILTR